MFMQTPMRECLLWLYSKSPHNWKVLKHSTVVYPHIIILLSNRQEETADTQNTTGSQIHYAKLRKLHLNEYTLCDSIYMASGKGKK